MEYSLTLPVIKNLSGELLKEIVFKESGTFM